MLLREILPQDFKQYAMTMRACHLATTCELESKFGCIAFDFQSFVRADTCIVGIRRKSGNGRVIVSTEDKVEEHNIVSKSAQYLNINIANAKIIELKRPQTSIGNIEIFNISICTSDNVSNYSIKEATLSGKNWRNILAKAKEHKRIRVVSGRMFASEGAFITAASNISVSTNPPNMYKAYDNMVKFVGSCEVTDLNINVQLPSLQKSLNFFPHFAAPAPIIVPMPKTEEPQIIPEQKSEAVSTAAIPAAAGGENVIYDSLSGNWFRNSNFFIGGAKFNGKSVVLGRGGSIVIPISAITANAEYIIVVEISKVSGNGKFCAYISTAPNNKQKIYFASPHHRAVNLTVTSGYGPHNESFKLIIDRPLSATGDVAISRVMFMIGPRTLPISAAYAQAHAQAHAQILAPFNTHFSNTFLSQVLNYTYSNSLNNIIENKSKNFAILDVEPYGAPRTFEIDVTVLPVSLSSRMWIKKIAPLFPGLKIHSSIKTIKNMASSHSNPSIAFCELGNLVQAKTIWIDEWNSDITNLSEGDINILKSCGAIVTTSLNNYHVLTQFLPDKKVVRLNKIWPLLNVERNPSNYFIYFEKNSNFTKQLITAWSAGFGDLVVVGTRIKLPQFVRYFSEYEPYNKILSYLLSARAVIDISANSHYNSAILGLSKHTNMNMITNNHVNFVEENNKCFYIKNDNDKSNMTNNIKEAINTFAAAGLTNQVNVNIDYNYTLYDLLLKLVAL